MFEWIQNILSQIYNFEFGFNYQSDSELEIQYNLLKHLRDDKVDDSLDDNHTIQL